MAMSSSSPRPCSDDWNACAVPWKLVVIADGSVVLAMPLISLTASPSETPGFVLNEIVTDGTWPEWFTASGPNVGTRFDTTSSGTSCPDTPRTHRIDSSSGWPWNRGSTSMMTWYSFVGA